MEHKRKSIEVTRDKLIEIYHCLGSRVQYATNLETGVAGIICLAIDVIYDPVLASYVEACKDLHPFTEVFIWSK